MAPFVVPSRLVQIQNRGSSSFSTSQLSFPSAFTVKYLMHYCGFPQQSAIAISRNLHLLDQTEMHSSELVQIYPSFVREMEDTSKDLLQLEHKNSSTSSLESTLLFFTQAKKPNSDGKPMMSPMPKSQVLGKVRDFLGVMSEANKRLQQEAKNNASEFDIEALSGNESNVIEMDLMLGVADLHTPEAVAAAESAIASYQPDITLPGSSSRTESEDSSDYDSDEEDEHYDKENTCPPSELKRSECGEDESMDEADGKQKPKKRPKIVELP